mgnify:CR=1 FL=1
MKILVVEDDLALSAGLCFELDMNGYITVAAYNCQKVRQLVQNETFDLAITGCKSSGLETDLNFAGK